MKKNKMMRLASILLVCVLLSTSVISGTFAKYTSTFEGTDSARVAKWAFTVGAETDVATTEEFTFELFKTVVDDDLSSEEDDIATGGDVIIAPGTGGSLGVALTNDSEVNATYTIDFTADEAEVPLQWSADGVTWVDNIDDLDVTTATDIDMEASTNIALYWKWAFEDDAIVTQTDDDDTELGLVYTAEPSVTVAITVTQVD